MANCESTPTPESTKNFTENIGFVKKFVESTNDTEKTPDGVDKKTITGIKNDADTAVKNFVPSSYKGVWAQGVIFNSPNEYFSFNDIPYVVKSGVSFPYTTQTASPLTAPDSDNVQPLSNVNYYVNSVSDLTVSLKDKVVGGVVFVKDDSRGGWFVYDQSKSAENNNGTVFNGWVRQFFGSIDVSWFGAVANQDSTVSIVEAITEAVSTVKRVSINNTYNVSTIVINGVNGLSIEGKGVLLGVATTATDSIIEFKNCTDIVSPKTIIISGDYNTNYESGVKIWASGGTSSLCNLDFTVTKCKTAWKIGDISEPDVLLSEITIGAGYTYACPSVIEVIGVQAVINVIGYQAISGVNGGDTAWQNLPRSVIKSIGALVSMTGGESQLNDVTNGNMFIVQPLLSPGFDNIYGKIICSNTEIESASQLFKTENPLSVPSPKRGLFSLSQCGGYHSQNSFPFIVTDAGFEGDIVISECYFEGGIQRTQPTIQCLGRANIQVDERSFKENFLSGLSAFDGGVVRFPKKTIGLYNNLSSQSCPGFSTTDLKFVSKPTGENYNRFNSDYDASTGEFTVPQGGLKDVELTINVGAASISPSVCELRVLKNNTPHSFAKGDSYITTSTSLGDLVEGDKIKVQIVTTTASAISFLSTFSDSLSIKARN